MIPHSNFPLNDAGFLLTLNTFRVTVFIDRHYTRRHIKTEFTNSTERSPSSEATTCSVTNAAAEKERSPLPIVSLPAEAALSWFHTSHSHTLHPEHPGHSDPFQSSEWTSPSGNQTFNRRLQFQLRLHRSRIFLVLIII